MIGPGIIVKIVNILPFAYFILSPFAIRRYNMLGMFSIGNRRTQYRQLWVRLFFGRFQYTTYAMVASFIFADFTKSRPNNKKMVAEFTAFTHHYEDFDEEESQITKNALVKKIYTERLEHDKELVLEDRAKRNYQMKIEAFNQYATENGL